MRRCPAMGLWMRAGLRALLSEKTLLVSVMGANNETGAIYPIRRLSRKAKKRGASLCMPIWPKP